MEVPEVPGFNLIAAKRAGPIQTTYKLMYVRDHLVNLKIAKLNILRCPQSLQQWLKKVMIHAID
jgi:hypothetical protein